MDMRLEIEKLETGLVNAAWSQAKSALSALRRGLGDEGAATAFGLTLERAMGRAFGMGEPADYLSETIEYFMSERLNGLGDVARGAAHMAIALCGPDATLLAEVKECCARMADNVAGSKAHWDWILANDDDHDGAMQFFHADDIQKNVLGALTLRMALDERGVHFEPGREERFHAGCSEIVDFAHAKATEFADSVMLGEAEHFASCYMDPDYSKFVKPELFEKIAALAEAREIGRGAKAGSRGRQKPGL